MSFRLPPTLPLHHRNPYAAASLLACAVAVLVATAVPAAAAEGLHLAQSTVPATLSARKLRGAEKPGGARVDGTNHRGRNGHAGNRRRPPPPAIVSVPDAPDRGGDRVPRRAERAPAALSAQTQSVPRQVLIVLDQNSVGRPFR